MVIVGAGRIGSALSRRAEARGQPSTLIRRGEALRGDGPVLLAVRNEDLPAAIAAVPEARRAAGVLVQNGAYHDLVARLGLGRVTRGVLWMLAAGGTSEPVTPLPSAFCGRHADAVTRWFEALGLPAEALEPEPFRSNELQKLLWLAILGPLCERWGATVGEVVRVHRDQVQALLSELLPVVAAAWSVTVRPGEVEDRIVAYSLGIPDYRASVKEWSFRNGWLRDQARLQGRSTPLQDALTPGR